MQFAPQGQRVGELVGLIPLFSAFALNTRPFGRILHEGSCNIRIKPPGIRRILTDGPPDTMLWLAGFVGRTPGGREQK
jgi:hypothetical protein